MEFHIWSITARSLIVELDDSQAQYRVEPYAISINGKVWQTSDKTVESVYGLEPGTAYEVAVTRGSASARLTVVTKPEFVTLDVRGFGAKGDGVCDDTAALQAAILCCPAGGRVYVPRGAYCFTHLFFKSDLTLDIDGEATLRAIPDKQKLPILPGRIESSDETSEYLINSWEGNPLDGFASLLTGIRVENVTICGRGTIDGGADFTNWWNTENRRNDPARPKMLFLNHCKNVTVQGVTFRNSPAWNMHPYFSEDITFADIRLESPADSHNTDGIDPESCCRVQIIGVYFSVGDDCIAIKSGKIYMGRKYKTPSRDIVIRNCLMRKGHGAVTIGSENAAGVDNIRIQDCVFTDTDRGLRVKTRRGRGRDSILRSIWLENIRMDRVRTPFVVNSFYFCGPDGKTDYVADKNPLPVDKRTPEVRDIHIRNVEVQNAHVAAAYIYGLPEKKIELVEMENVSISFANHAAAGTAAMMAGCEPAARQGIFIRNVHTIRLKNVTVTGAAGKPLDIAQVDEIEGALLEPRSKNLRA